MAYMSQEEILERVKGLDQDQFNKWVKDNLPCMKKKDGIKEIFDLIFSRNPDPWNYNDPKYQLAYDELEKFFSKFTKGKIVIDIGAEKGTYWRHHNDAKKLFLNDISEVCVNMGKEAFKDQPNVEWINYDMVDIPYSKLSDKPEVVVQCNALYFVPAGCRRTLWNSIKMLKAQTILTGTIGEYREFMFDWPNRYVNKILEADGYEYIKAGEFTFRHPVDNANYCYWAWSLEKINR